MGVGPISVAHHWVQDPTIPSGAGVSPRRLPSPLMRVIKETWFLIGVGVAVVIALSAFIGVVYYKRKKNEKRAINGESAFSNLVCNNNLSVIYIAELLLLKYKICVS